MTFAFLKKNLQLIAQAKPGSHLSYCRRSGGRSAPRPAARAPLRNPPKTSCSCASAAPVQSGNGLSGLVATVADGMAFGTGIAVAHRAVDAVLGPCVIKHETVASPAPAAAPAPSMTGHEGQNACGNYSMALQDCLNNYGSDIKKCQFYNTCCKNAAETRGP